VYSFIAPRKKTTIDTFSYMWLIFIVLTSILLIGVGLYIDGENGKFNIYKVEYKEKIEQDKQKRLTLQKKINGYKLSYKKSKESSMANNTLKTGLQNLLLFIPDEIKINKLQLDKYDVKIYGITDSPKTYKLLLEPPLKSIFDSTRVGFTKKDDGTYLFSSYNKIKRKRHAK